MREHVAYKRLEGRVGLDANTLEWSTGILNRRILGHGAIAGFFNRRAAVQRNETGIGVEGQEKIDDRQSRCDKWGTLHVSQDITQSCRQARSSIWSQMVWHVG